MEIKNIIFFPYSKELKEKKEKEQKQKEEASKTFGEYLISISNLCFDKCMNVDNVYISKSEENCVKNCFNKFSEAHTYSFEKFQKINILIEQNTLSRSKEYGDYYDIFAEEAANS
jgi:hypothetical protein